MKHLQFFWGICVWGAQKKSALLPRISNRLTIAVFAFLTFAVSSQAAVLNYYGSGADPVTGWKAGTDSLSWTAKPSLNDPVDGGGKLDFVGDTQNPGFFMAQNAAYLFFRMRVNVASAPTGTFTDAHLLLINVDGWNYLKTGQTDGDIDYAITWDSKSDPTKHGLEMQIPSTLGVAWDAIRMADIDGKPSDKVVSPTVPGDFNTTTDGFVRTVDGQSSASLGGNTTFIDYAVSKAYLTLQAPNILNYDLRIQLASIANATDHNAINADVAGSASPTSIVADTWSASTPIPEPSTVGLISLFFVCSSFWLKRRSLRASA